MQKMIWGILFLLFFATIFLGFAQEKREVAQEKPGVVQEKQETQKPLVDHPEKLKPLDVKGEIWVTEDKKSVVFLGTVCMNKGPLEFFLCSTNTKDYESVVSTSVKPYIIHAGLLVTGIEPGTPVKHTPEFVTPKGPEVEVAVRWLDKAGNRKEMNAKEWVQNEKTKKSMETSWVFTGSLFRKMPNGMLNYLADSTGEIIGVSNFPTVVLDVPFESTDKNDSLLFQAFEENIPEPGTPVTLILTPRNIP